MNKINWRGLKKYINQLVVVTLDDHAMGREIIPCRCVGWLAEITNRKVMLVHWDVLTKDKETRDLNIECTSLARKAITDIRPLKTTKILK